MWFARPVFTHQTPALAGVLLGVLHKVLRGRWRWLGVAVAALWLSGCATPTAQLAELQAQWPADLPTQAQISNVPFIAQEDYQCGPAALAMAAQHAGVQRDMATWVAQVYVPARQGALQTEMLAASRRNGLPAYTLAPRIDALLREVAAGNPVLVLQNLAFGWSPVWHYAVVIGFDQAQGTVTLHSGRTASMPMLLTTFERTWARADRWAMVALAPQRLPATAQADAYVASVVALERVQPAAAQAAYATALQAWPAHRIALLGSGNSAYTLGQLGAAVKAYSAATQAYPQDGDAWNNLAQVLLDTGQHRAALEAAQRAVAVGGSRAVQYRTLVQEIVSKTPIAQ
jgi:tetratricopeptide (TPR) repeat protein